MSPEEQQIQLGVIKTFGTGLLPETSYDIFREKLAAYIQELIDQDLEKLVFLLYRLDISEQKLRSILSTAPPNAAIVIADLIIERQLQKIETRKQFSSPKKDIPEEDQW